MSKAVRVALAAGLVALVLIAGLPARPAATAGAPPWAVLVGPAFDRFVPGTEKWEVALGIVGDGWGQVVPVLKGVRVTLDGSPLTPHTLAVREGTWARAAGRVTHDQIQELRRTAAAALHGRPPAPVALPALERTAGLLAGMMAEAEPTVVTLEGMSGTSEGVHVLEVSLDYKVGERQVTLTEQVEVAVTALPTAPGWFAADLHIHSTYSDGDKTPAGLKADLASRGYYIGYLTDHTAALIGSGAFTSMSGPYPTDCKNASDTTTSLFPGVELEVGHKVLGIWNGDGHALGYGVASTSGLNDKYWGPQAGLDQVNANNSPQSSAAIAHPVHLIYNWEDWTVLRYYGIELMSGLQWYFDVNSGGPSQWRSECARLQSYSASFVPSVRTGSDYHTGWQSYVTHIKLPSDSTWFGGSWEQRRSAVDSALKQGRTAISRKGSLAYITADGYEVGSTYSKASGATVSFTVYLKPVVSGTYNLYLYRDNLAATVWSRTSQSLTAGTAYTWTCSYTYPGGSHYFWLYVSGEDYCYTTPIYMTP